MEIVKKILNWKILLLLFGLIAMFFLYSYELGHPYFGLYCDEADVGLNAAALGANLRNINDQFLPLFTEGFGFRSIRPPVYLYLSAPIVKVLGLSVYSTRILAVISALLAVMFLVLLANKLFNGFVATLAGLLLVFSPGFFHIQRVAFELTTFNFCFLGFLYFTLHYIEKKKVYWLVLSGVFFIMAFYSYLPSKVFLFSTLAIFGIVALIEKRKQIPEFIKNNKIMLGVSSAVFFVVIVVPNVITYFGNHHFANLSLLGKDRAALNAFILIKKLKETSPDLFNFLNSAPAFFTKVYIFITNYINSYSYNLLFMEGDGNSRHMIPHENPLPVIFLGLIFVGLFVLIWHIKENKYRFFLIAFFCIGIPSGLIMKQIELTHIVHMYPLWALIVAIGLVSIIDRLSFGKVWIKPILATIVMIFVIVPFVSYLNLYFGDFKQKKDIAWEAHRDELVQYIADNYKNYSQVYYTTSLHEIQHHLAFYGVALHGMPIQDFQAARNINKKMPFGIKSIQHKLNKPNIQLQSLNDYYGNNILIMLDPKNEMPDCKPLKVFYYNNKIPLARFCKF